MSQNRRNSVYSFERWLPNPGNSCYYVIVKNHGRQILGIFKCGLNYSLYTIGLYGRLLIIYRLRLISLVSFGYYRVLFISIDYYRTLWMLWFQLTSTDAHWFLRVDTPCLSLCIERTLTNEGALGPLIRAHKAPLNNNSPQTLMWTHRALVFTSNKPKPETLT